MDSLQLTGKVTLNAPSCKRRQMNMLTNCAPPLPSSLPQLFLCPITLPDPVRLSGPEGRAELLHPRAHPGLARSSSSAAQSPGRRAGVDWRGQASARCRSQRPRQAGLGAGRPVAVITWLADGDYFALWVNKQLDETNTVSCFHHYFLLVLLWWRHHICPLLLLCFCYFYFIYFLSERTIQNPFSTITHKNM